MTTFSRIYIDELTCSLNAFAHDEFDQMISCLISAHKQQRSIFLMGNGGSAATASHWACDLAKGCAFDGNRRFRVICLNDNIAIMLAYANDISYDYIFVEQLKNFFKPKDVVIGISGSGNSTNVIKAVEFANNNGGTTVGLCGFDGGKLYRIVDIPLLAKVHDMQKVEDTHMIIAHMAMQRICQIFRREQPIEYLDRLTASA